MIEREIKFRIPEGSDAASVSDAIQSAGFRLEPTCAVSHEDRYLDTEDWLLHRAGIALRLRREGAKLLLQAKAVRSRSEEAMERAEWEQIAPEGDPPWTNLSDGPVASLLRPLGVYGLLERIQVRARVACDRQLFRWLRGDEVLGAVSLDRVRDPGATNGGSSYQEVEVELGDGARDALGEVREAVEGQLGVTARVESKLATALAAAGERLPERDERAFALHVGDRLVDVAVKTLGRHLTRMLWNEPGVRLGVDPNYVHDMRVATRRLRTALEVLAQAIPEETRDDFARELRWIGRALGRVRDLDVGLEHVAAMAADDTLDAQAAGAERAALGVFVRYLEIRRARRRVELLERLDSERYAAFAERARAWIAGGALDPTASAPPAALVPAYHAGPRVVAEWDRRMREAYQTAHDDPSPGNVHALRIAAKHARYAVEYFAELDGPNAYRRAKRLARLQDTLGARQDCDALLRHMRRYAKSIPPRDRELTLGAGAVMGQLERASRIKRGELREAWEAATDGGQDE